MSKLSKMAAGLAVVPMLAFAAPAIAASPGQFQAGSNTYLVKNITKNGSYASTANATCNEELKYSFEVHNIEFSKITNIVVKASLPGGTATSNTSDATASGTNSANTTVSTSGSVTVGLNPAGAVSYEGGSTNLYDDQGNVIKALPDGITTGGVNVGDLNGSTTEFVNFKAKVNCPTTPPSTPPTTPKQLVNTGAGDVAGLFAGVAILGALGHRLFLGRKLSRDS